MGLNASRNRRFRIDLSVASLSLSLVERAVINDDPSSSLCPGKLTACDDCLRTT